MKIVLFANSSLANSGMQVLLQHNLLAGLVVAKPLHFETEQLAGMAKQYGVPVLTLEKKKLQPILESWLNRMQPDVALVMTFPYKIPQRILDRIPKGMYNFHMARLPQYRGSEPIFWEVFNREPFGAVSVHRMDAGFDTGPLVLQQQVAIDPEDTYGMLRSRLGQVAAQLVVPLLNQLSKNEVQEIAQDESMAKYWPKPGYQDVLIDFQQMERETIQALVKAGNPWNKGALTYVRNLPVKVVETEAVEQKVPEGIAPGTILDLADESGVVVACRNQCALRIHMFYLEEEGFLTGTLFRKLGIAPGECFANPQ